MGFVSLKSALLFYWIVSGCISFSSCSGPQEISGIYQKLDNYPSDNFGFTTLILREDSTFQYNEFSDEVCYQSNFGACGVWMFANDSIYLKLFDTISLQTKYLPDTSDQLTIEIFDNYDCQFLIPTYFYSGNFPESIITIGFGYFRGYLPSTVKEVSVAGANNFLKPLQIKNDSMHIQIHGMSMGYSTSVEEMRFVQKGSNLYQLYKSKQSSNKLNPSNQFKRKENLEYFEYMYQW